MERRVACSTCHRRKVKCDRRLPKCSACERLKLECGQSKAASRLAWVEAKEFSNREIVAMESDACARRRALFSDAEREAECARLLEQVSHHHIEKLLQDLDNGELRAMDAKDPQFAGPFGVFPLHPGEGGLLDISSGHLETYAEEVVYDDATKNSDLGGRTNILTEQQLVEFGLFDQGIITPNFGSNFLDDIFDFGNISADMEQTPMYQDAFPGMEDPEFNTVGRASPERRKTMNTTSRSPSPLTVSVPLQFAADVGNLNPVMATALLAHYRDEMIPSLLSHKHHKPPWKVLHLPAALAAYGEIALLGDTNNARASLLFAIFAMSALNLAQLQQSKEGKPSQWRLVGESYREKAKQRLQACLGEQGDKVKKAKYKEVLMAILSMITTCVVTGQMAESRCFLLDAERFIYTHGLSKVHKSRKVLMLHCIFLYLRVVEETTCISNTNTPATLSKTVYHHINNDGSFSCRYPTLWTERLVMSLKPDTRAGDNLEMQLMAFPVDIKEPSVFEQVYGIPESLFRSISHATYLANALQRNWGISNKDLDKSIKALETKICNWKNPHRLMALLGPSRSSDELETRYGLLFHFLEAIHSALMIYFYRRVRDMNTVALQHFVAKTINHLLEHERMKAEAGDRSWNFCWPGFIAACEALDLDQRRAIEGWLSRSAKSSGLGMFDTAKDVTAKLWKARGTTGNPDISWEDMVANGNTALILS